ncbi:X2-like carbohydrate binding domain-containing protein [Clostridium neuense]|uniref:X2-like carbohydrate binding domain-containing protein n=1 Tax=Clostridium neuense TaxID=1728934 RepID=A0ABW8TKI4_9CLOT
MIIIYIVDTSNNRIRKIDAVTGNISTIAGTTQAGYAGDGEAAINAMLNSPRGICLDKDGNIYIADYGNGRIRKIDGAGIITTIAGNGSRGLSGDGNLATNAVLSPTGLAIDNEGNMYVADYSNNRIRKIDGAGIITTIAGTGVSGFSFDNSSAVNATLSYPRSVAVDSIGNVFIADTFNSEIRKLSMPQAASGLTVTTEAEVPAKQDKVMLSVSSGIVEGSDKIYYKVDDTVPQQLYVGDTIDLNDWTEFIGGNSQEITAPNGKYIEAVEVTAADNKVVKWGKSNVVNDGYVVSASLSRNAASFDKNTSNQADVNVDMTLNGNTLTSIVNGVIPLINGIDYTANENTVTINKSYLASLDAGATANLVFNFSAGDSQSLNVAVTDTTPSAACGLTVTAEAETPAVSGKVTLTVTPAVDDSHHVICYKIVDSEPTALNVGEEIEPGDGWIELANTNVQEIAVANGKYIEAVEVTTGNYKVTKWGKSSAVNDGCIVQVGSSISPITASFDKNTANQADVNVSMGLSKYKLESISMRNGANYLSHEFRGNTVTIKKSDLANLSSQSAELAFYDDKGNIKNLDVAMLVGDMGVDLTMSLNGKSLTSITNEGNTLVNGTDYVVNGSTVTIKRGFLTKVGTGTVNLVFNFGTESLAMTVSLSGTDLSATMILDGNTLTGINNSDYDLINGVDYTVNGDVVTISKGYLAKLATGTQDLMFNFSKGNAQKLSITISDTTTRSYTVTFKDYDGKTIGEPQTVNYGESAAAPAAPTRTGYVFAGWDKSYNDVTGDLVVTAKYTSGNTYPFQPTTSNGDDETKISTDYLKSRDNTLVINSAAASLAIPSSAIDLVNGADHIKVTEKVVTPETNTVQGLFGNLPNGVAKMVGNPIRLNVGLFDASDALIQDIHQFSNNQRVKVTIKLTSAQIAGLDTSKLSMYYYDETSRTWVELGGSFNTNTMEFTFYTPHFTNFAIMNKASTPTPSTGNTTPVVTSYTVTFKNYDGTVIGTPQAVNYGGSATAPAAPTRTGYVFAGWDKAFDKVTGDLVVTAKYTSGNTYNFKPTATSNGAETKISSDYLTSRDNTLVINSDGAEISIPAGAIDSTDGTSYIKVIEQSDTAANISNKFGNLPKGLKQVGNPLLLSIELFDANNNYIKNIHKLANNEKIKVTMKFTADELKGIDVNGPSMYYYDETAKAWAKLEGKFNPSTREMTFYMTEL